MESTIEYHCPQCYYIPIYSLEENNYQKISISCPNNHQYEFLISTFFGGNPFGNLSIKCNHCNSSPPKVYDIHYCINCKKYLCNKDKNNYHNTCNNVIELNDLFSSCLEHNSPKIKFCRNCEKEICYYCFNSHLNHNVSEDSFEDYKTINDLKYSIMLEKIFVNDLISKQNNEQKKFNNLMRFYEFIKYMVFKEKSKFRYSIALFISYKNVCESILNYKNKINLSNENKNID